MKSNWLRFLIWALVAFGLGAGFALFQEKGQTAVQPPAVSASAVVPPVAEQSEPLRPGELPVSENISKPEMMAGVPVGGAFLLTDHHGNPVTEKSWPGKYRLVFFGFTHCPDICPVTLQKISSVMESYDPTGEKLVPLLITVDPERDTPEVLAAYVAGYNPHIIGLTGTRDQVNDAIDAYKVFAAKIPDGHEYKTEAEAAAMQHQHTQDYMMDHSGYVYLMSPDDRLLETFGTAETAEGMIAKIKAHMEQAPAPGAKAPDINSGREAPLPATIPAPLTTP